MKSEVDALLNLEQNVITGGASTIVSDHLTFNQALISNGSGKVAVSNVTDIELGYLSGLSSNLQIQLSGLQVNVMWCFFNNIIKFNNEQCFII